MSTQVHMNVHIIHMYMYLQYNVFLGKSSAVFSKSGKKLGEYGEFFGRIMFFESIQLLPLPL